MNINLFIWNEFDLLNIENKMPLKTHFAKLAIENDFRDHRYKVEGVDP